MTKGDEHERRQGVKNGRSPKDIIRRITRFCKIKRIQPEI
jgi:hypothetical protein